MACNASAGASAIVLQGVDLEMPQGRISVVSRRRNGVEFIDDALCFLSSSSSSASSSSSRRLLRVFLRLQTCHGLCWQRVMSAAPTSPAGQLALGGGGKKAWPYVPGGRLIFPDPHRDPRMSGSVQRDPAARLASGGYAVWLLERCFPRSC